MANKKIYPEVEAQFVLWFENFVRGIAANAAALGIGAAKVAQLQADAVAVRQKLTEVDSAKRTLASVVALKDAAFAEVKQRLHKIVAVSKLADSYTDAVGVELGIHSGTSRMTRAQLDAAVPHFTATMIDTGVLIEWLKHGFSGVAVYCQRCDETEFTLLARDTVSPYIDKRPNLVPGQPEVRLYRLKYLLGDEEVGCYSAEVRVVVLVQK